MNSASDFSRITFNDRPLFSSDVPSHMIQQIHAQETFKQMAMAQLEHSKRVLEMTKKTLAEGEKLQPSDPPLSPASKKAKGLQDVESSLVIDSSMRGVDVAAVEVFRQQQGDNVLTTEDLNSSDMSGALSTTPELSALEQEQMKMVEDANTIDFSMVDGTTNQVKRMTRLFSLDCHNTIPVQFPRVGNWMGGVQLITPSEELGGCYCWDYTTFTRGQMQDYTPYVECPVVDVCRYDINKGSAFFISPETRKECRRVLEGRTFTYKVYAEPEFPGDDRVVVNMLTYKMRHYDHFVKTLEGCSDLECHPCVRHFLKARADHPSEFFIVPLGLENFMIPVPKRFILPIFCNESGMVKYDREATFVIGYIPFDVTQKFKRQQMMSEKADYRRTFNLFCCMECFNKDRVFLFHSMDECVRHHHQCKRMMGSGPMPLELLNKVQIQKPIEAIMQAYEANAMMQSRSAINNQVKMARDEIPNTLIEDDFEALMNDVGDMSEYWKVPGMDTFVF